MRPQHGKAIPGYAMLVRTLTFNDQGLIPAIIQDAKSREVLTLCYLNKVALKKSLATGTVYVYRRSQQQLMQKGVTSGHIQRIREVRPDCEGKSLLLRVTQKVAACHAGYFSCYVRRLKGRTLAVSAKRVFDPKQVYR